jgi:hypothetical protein
MTKQPWSRGSELSRWKRVRQTGFSVCTFFILLGALTACNSTSAPTHTGSTTKTVPVEQPSVTTNVPSPTPNPTTPPTATPNLGIFQVTFVDQYSAVACSGTTVVGMVCVTTTGSGQENGLGSISLKRTSVYTPGANGDCDSATTTGTLTLATSDTVTFKGNGTFCPGNEIANFSYTITGGTGQYLHATGTGTIDVPVPSSSSSGTEVWSGTLFS